MRIRFKPWARPEVEASKCYRDDPEKLKNKWIEEFENKAKAEDYKTAMFLTDYLFGGINEEQYKVLLISKTNYPIFWMMFVSSLMM